MKLIVTGCTGFLGSHLTRALVLGGHTVVGLKRSTSADDRVSDITDSVIWHEVDRVPISSVVSEHSDATAVLHTATCYGRTESDAEVAQANIAFPLELLEQSAKGGIPLFINTDSCFNRADITYKYLQSYSLSKRQFSEWGKAYSLSGRIQFASIKLQHPYGPADNPAKFVPSIIRECLTSTEEIKLTPGQQRKDFVFVEDVVSAFRAALESRDELEPFSELECGTGQSVSIREFVETIHKVTNSKATLAFGALPYRENEVMDSHADISKLTSLGWETQVSLREGIQAIVDSDNRGSKA